MVLQSFRRTEITVFPILPECINIFSRIFVIGQESSVNIEMDRKNE